MYHQHPGDPLADRLLPGSLSEFGPALGIHSGSRCHGASAIRGNEWCEELGHSLNRIESWGRTDLSGPLDCLRFGRRGRTRTCDPQLRRLMLYPPELRARKFNFTRSLNATDRSFPFLSFRSPLQLNGHLLFCWKRHTPNLNLSGRQDLFGSSRLHQ